MHPDILKLFYDKLKSKHGHKEFNTYEAADTNNSTNYTHAYVGLNQLHKRGYVKKIHNCNDYITYALTDKEYNG